jgi:hypothetical protein
MPLLTRGRKVPGLLASFAHVDAAADAIRALRARGHKKLTVYSAAPNHELEEALEHGVSPVRLITLIGGLTGCAAGFGMTLWMSHDWPVVVGGKPIGSIPPYVVIAFELTILLGGLATALAMLALARLPRFRRSPTYDARFTRDKFGVAVRCDSDEVGSVRDILVAAGAEEVRP